MSLEEVKEIRNTFDSRMANAMFVAGWILISVTPGTTEDGSPWPMYTLGWKGPLPAATVQQTW